MSENSTVISPTMLGVSSGVAGMGLGYVIAPRKYPIERLLTRRDDTFEKTFSPEAMADATIEEKKSLKNIKVAVEEYRRSGDSLLKSEVTPAAEEWKRMVDGVWVYKNVKDNLKAKKKFLKNAVKSSDYYGLRANLKNAQTNALANPNDTAVNTQLKNASAKFSEAQKALENPIREYKKAFHAYKSAKENAIANLPDKGKAISMQFEKFTAAVTKRADVMYKKLAELTKREGIAKDYKNIEKYIPKARTHSAIMGGIIAGLVGILAGVFYSNKEANV